MENIIWYIIMIPCSVIFTGIGIFSWKRKEPMWFWSGTTVKECEIRDIASYNRENGIMWIIFSIPLWISTFAKEYSVSTAMAFIVVDFTVGIAILITTYKKIYNKYKI